MIITFEGPPAAGKSTTAGRLASENNAFVVPEVNRLFPRVENESRDWYLSRQVERWEIGMRQRGNYDSVIFDGDLFQPLWFCWIFHDENWGNLNDKAVFYRRAFLEQRIAFPDVFVVFTVDKDERWNRELKRGAERGRDRDQIKRQYDRYQRLVAPQHRYFKALQSKFPERFLFLDSISVEENVEFISSITKADDNCPDIDIFDFLVGWLTGNRADETPVNSDASTL